MCSNVSLPYLHIAQLKSGEYLSLKLTFISKTPSLALKIILAEEIKLSSRVIHSTYQTRDVGFSCFHYMFMPNA